jgi:hypothetical protein
MTDWGRRFADHFAASDLAMLQSATWDGRCWSIPMPDPAVMQRLAAEGLVEERGGIWALTLNGHRHRRAAPRPSR